jgi:hypothetical protein
VITLFVTLAERYSEWDSPPSILKVSAAVVVGIALIAAAVQVIGK